MLTEAEAREKWCPKALTLEWDFGCARVGAEPTVVGASVNRTVVSQDETRIDGRHRCIASGCMAWRAPLSWYNPESGNEPNDEKRGYCGAFGRPE